MYLCQHVLPNSLVNAVKITSYPNVIYTGHELNVLYVICKHID